MTIAKKLTIFEGPDGSGKSTAAKAYAAATGALYVHFSALPHVKQSIGRTYIEAMLPALLGYQDVVFDRCWLSEKPYGDAFRGGAVRLDAAEILMLERVAMRCEATVVYCRTDVDVMLGNFTRRKDQGGEMLESQDQWLKVYEGYSSLGYGSATQLPIIVYDYQKTEIRDLIKWLNGFGTRPHHTSQPTVGNIDAKVCLVGESFAERKEFDSWYQWPFVSFGKQGCSHWLAEYLRLTGINEIDLCWANADFDLTRLSNQWGPKHYIALGASAAEALDKAGLTYDMVPHPQHQKRFNHGGDYALAHKLLSVIG